MGSKQPLMALIAPEILYTKLFVSLTRFLTIHSRILCQAFDLLGPPLENPIDQPISLQPDLNRMVG